MRLDFEAQKNCTLAGRRFRSGQQIHVEFSDDFAVWFQKNMIANGGPWGYGAYRSADILALCQSVEDDAGNEVFVDYSRRRGKFYLAFETGADDYAVGPFETALGARAFGELQMNASEGTGQGEFIVVPQSRVPARILKIVTNPSMVQATKEQLDAIDMGRKAPCLS